MNLLTSLQTRWQGASKREQGLLLAALALLLAALLWWVGLAPALTTLRAAATQQRGLDADLQHMRQLQAQAQSLQAQPKIALDEARRRLETALKPMGASAQLSLVGERATLTLKGASADALAQWLTQVRLNARALPAEAHLLRNAAGAWDGTVVLNLGAGPGG
jgi:general secretion pathway protein M